MIFTSKLSPVLFLCAALPMLVSCGGGNLPVVNATAPNIVAAQRFIPDEDIDFPFQPTLAMAPSGGVTVLRRSGSKQIVFEHYGADTLGVEWSLPLATEKKEVWTPTIRYKNGKLNCLGTNTYDGGDSIGIHFMSIDAATHQISADRWSGRGDAGVPSLFHRPTVSPYLTEISPDSNLILFSRMEFADMTSDKKTGRTMNVHGELYDIEGTLKKAFDLQFPIPDVIENRGELYFRHKGLQIDNAGNLYSISFLQPGTLEITKYPGADISSPMVLSASFKNIDVVSGFKMGKPVVTFDPVTGEVLVSSTREKMGSASMFMPEDARMFLGAVPKGFVLASFDFASKQVRSFQYDPAPEFLDTLLDQKNFDDYRIIRTIHDNAQKRTLLFLEKRMVGVSTHSYTSYTPSSHAAGAAPNPMAASPGSDWTTHSYSHSYNNCGGILFLCFDDAGKPLWQVPIPKDQSHKADYCVTSLTPSKMDIYYVDRTVKLEGLQKRQFDLSSGILSPEQNILQFESDTYVLTNYTLWQDQKNAIMFASGFTTFGGGHPRNPMVFKLKVQ